MVEAPRIRITYEKINITKNGKIIHAHGPSYKKIGINLEEYIIRKWWFAGKYIYAYLVKENSPSYVIRTHLMMYGKIILNDEIEVNPKLTPFMILELDNGNKLTWYLSQVKLLDPFCKSDIIKSNYTTCSSKEVIKYSITMTKYDISHKNFDRDLLIKHIKTNFVEISDDMLVDLLLNQKYFPGVGNILQQEALYRCRLLPTRSVKSVPFEDIECLIDELKKIIDILYEAYLDKGKNMLYKPILQIYHKSACPLGHKTITKYLGYHDRRTTWCPIDQQ